MVKEESELYKKLNKKYEKISEYYKRLQEKEDEKYNLIVSELVNFIFFIANKCSESENVTSYSENVDCSDYESSSDNEEAIKVANALKNTKQVLVTISRHVLTFEISEKHFIYSKEIPRSITNLIHELNLEKLKKIFEKYDMDIEQSYAYKLNDYVYHIKYEYYKHFNNFNTDENFSKSKKHNVY